MLRQNHHRHLITTFRHLDSLLTEAADKLGTADAHRLFSPYKVDATPAQQKVLRDYLDQLRFVLKRFMDRHALEVPEPTVSALHAFHTSLTFARIAAFELRPEYLEGYGELTPADAEEVLRVIAEINGVLHRIGTYLRGGEGGDLSTRLANLAGTHNEIALLRALAEIIERRGSVEFRTGLDDLLARIESPRYDIAFFGRVSAGKSSLLNFIVGQAVLPIGVTPVTSVVTRLRHAASPHLRVAFASEPSLDGAIEQVADFVTEERNPANAKHVIDVTLELPVPILASGVQLIDTPGLGTLATTGAAQTLTYLPRCDLGVMLIDGGGMIGRDDLAVARYVIESGSELIVLLSKADLVSDSDRDTLIRYVCRQFQDALGIDVAVAPVSTVSSKRESARAWLETELLPRLEQIQEAASTSLRRKIAVLRENVVATLQAQLDGGSPDRGGANDQSLASRFAQVRADIEATRRELDDAGYALAGGAEMLIEVSAAAIADSDCNATDLAARAQNQVMTTLQRVADAMQSRLDTLRDSAGAALRSAETTIAGRILSNEPLPSIVSRPLFDPGVLKINSPFPAWALRFPPFIRKGVLKRALRQFWQPALHEHLQAYAAALRVWSDRYLRELAHLFDMDAAPIEHRWRASAAIGDDMARGDSQDLEQDLRQLLEWPQGR